MIPRLTIDMPGKAARTTKRFKDLAVPKQTKTCWCPSEPRLGGVQELGGRDKDLAAEANLQKQFKDVGVPKQISKGLEEQFKDVSKHTNDFAVCELESESQPQDYSVNTEVKYRSTFSDAVRIQN